MVRTVELEQAKTRLTELIKEVALGDEVLITEQGEPVAKLMSPGERKPNREPGSAKGLFSVPNDFDAPLPEFEEYS